MTTAKKYLAPLLYAGLFWALLVTVLRALRSPNDWAMSHWLIHYQEFGFIKRGLPGTLLAFFADTTRTQAGTLSLIHIMAFSLLLLFMAILLYLSIRVIKKNNLGASSVLIALVFLTSPYVVMSAHLNGYFDNILVLITVLSCLLLMKDKVWLAACLLALGVLVHETMILVGLPSVLFFAGLQSARATSTLRSSERLWAMLKKYYLLLVLPLASFSAIFTSHRFFLDATVLQQDIEVYLSGFGFVAENLKHFISTSFTVSFADYYARMSGRFWLRFFWGDFIFKTGAPVLLLLFFCWRRLQSFPCRRVLFLALVIIVLLPVSLHVIAWDSSRIWTYPVIVAMLAVWGVSEIAAPAGREEKAPPVFLVLSITLVLYQLFTQILLMDYATERFATGERALLYAPVLLWLAWLLYRNLAPART